MLNTCFPSGSLEFWSTRGRQSLRDQSPIKPLGTGSLGSFPGRQHFAGVVITLLQELSASFVTPVGEDS